MKNLLRFSAIVLLGTSIAFSQFLPSNGLKGLWKFDDAASLGKATNGNALALKHMITATGDVNKFVAIAGPASGDGAVTVGLGSYFECTPDLKPNGADTAKNVNQYTIAMDVRFPKKEWHTMIKYDPTMYADTIRDGLGAIQRVGPRFTNDGDLFYANSSYNGAVSALGTAASGYTYDTTGLNQWYRLVVTADLAKSDYRIYLDGQLALQGKTTYMTIDGRFSIRSIDGANKLIFLGDDDGDDGDMDVAFIALYDRPIGADTVALMGGYGHSIRKLDPVAQWDFEDNSAPLKALPGLNLTIVGKDSSVAGPKVDNKARSIGNGSYYIGQSTINPNGATAATRSNLYAVKIDFRVKSLSTVHPILQTDSTNKDGAEVSISTTGTVGNPTIGYSTDAVAAGKWQRLIINANLGKSFELWLDGKRIKQTGAQTIDGQYSIGAIGTVKSLLFFADNAAYAGYIDVASLAVWNRSLDSAEIFSLAGVPVPPADTAKGQGGYSVFMDGTSSNPYVKIDAHADFKFDSTKSFSLELWTKANQAWAGDPAIMSNKDWGSGGNTGWIIAADANRTNTWLFNLADEFRNRVDITFKGDSSAYLGDAKWHQIAVTVDRPNKIAKTYMDGKFLKSISLIDLHGSIDAGYPICLGQDGTTHYSDGYNYGGYVDEVRIWNGVALDSTTIQTWRTKTLNSTHPAWGNLAGYWNFEEGRGITSADKSPKGHTATLVNNVEWRTSQAALPVLQLKQNSPDAFELANAYPNPFNPSTTIRFSLAAASHVKLIVFNILGQEVTTLVNEKLAAGTHQAEWNAASVAGRAISSGVYFYRLEVAGAQGVTFTRTNKVVLLK